mgnify:FL=1
MVALGLVEEFRRRSLTSAEVAGTPVVVVMKTQGFRVVENRCPHQQADILHEGTIDANGLTCPIHGRTFDLSSGACRNGAGKLSFLHTDERDGVLWVSPLASPDFKLF